ncbi:hypothetical protein HFO63_03555 [Rhizobium laguerreae]|uniref:Uncharacterized protein n=1 Tax=Rhizobium laguerreae TaxID=1076926 RepID=A0ABR6G335_9HYPH|nr:MULTISPECIES: hypothetical protein [Rhizobium]MBB3159782.1 hypothetical protein [Rhizobium laguerreae]MBY3084343.1 hypothetical protein [Rhizobium laguerreae]MBY3097079.1 hypothetical protein [Rhizobium laguerreae]MBY3105133.1 hypothetical protein [Rhizobium laguerreae]MBY3123929.1 hypothetical protein [Rhizobium laguerreae]
MANTTHELAASFAEEWLILPFDCAEMRGNTGFSRGDDFKILPLGH